jgi:hypothetical protein
MDPNPLRVGDMLNVLAKAAHGPAFTVKINANVFGLAPRALTRGLMALTPFRRMRKMMMKELGLPDDIFMFVNYPTRLDSRETHNLLRPAGIVVPPFEEYAWRLWDYWERNLDPDLFVDRSLRGAVQGKRVLVTGGSAGIGKAIALRLAQAGAKTLIVARDQEKLDLTRKEFSAQGLELETYSADISETTRGARSVARSRTLTTACTTSSGLCGSTISRPCKSRWASCPEWLSGAPATSSISLRSRPSRWRRASRPTSPQSPRSRRGRIARGASSSIATLLSPTSICRWFARV